MKATQKIAALLVLGASVLGVGARSVSAQVNFSAGTLNAGAACNRTTHTMTMQASMVLSTRFPNGAYVATRYAYFYVNTALQPISATYTTGWQYANVPSSTRRIDADTTISNQIAWLPAVNVSTWGQLRVMAQIGVWNGSYYEYSGWDLALGYDNHGPMGSYNYAGSCWASLT
jgi:hypothetical protein